ncbi:unnamed protein product [Linum trigynum]|uniref:Uncharacterized protein n=1 Tax=Linum trigynum TaxID=586398 RepID=A0AAV2ESS9_9ROSI
MVLDLAEIRELKLRSIALRRDIVATCTEAVVTLKQLKARCREWELNDDRATIPAGKRNDGDVARVDANGIRATEDIKISVNKIGVKEAVRKGVSHLSEDIIPQSERSVKKVAVETRSVGGEVVVQQGSYEKEVIAARAQSKGDGAEGSLLGLVDRQPTTCRAPVVRLEFDDPVIIL